MKKDDFIKILASATPIEINEMIKNKGKPKKLIKPFIIDNSDCIKVKKTK